LKIYFREVSQVLLQEPPRLHQFRWLNLHLQLQLLHLFH
jgi:hypothetical protein